MEELTAEELALLEKQGNPSLPHNAANPLKDETTKSTYGITKKPREKVNAIEGATSGVGPKTEPGFTTPEGLPSIRPDNMVDLKEDGAFATDITGTSGVAAGLEVLQAIPGTIAAYKQDFGKLDNSGDIKKATRARSLGVSTKVASAALTLTGNPIIAGIAGVTAEIGQRAFGDIRGDVVQMEERQRWAQLEKETEKRKQLEDIWGNKSISETANQVKILKKQAGLIG